MNTSKKITVQSTEISVLIGKNDNDYISLTDMVKANDEEDLIRNWMRNKNTLEYLGVWESLNNPNFKRVCQNVHILFFMHKAPT
ncbi:KilA-N domain-containing protein, partial [Prevotella jejuni]